MEDVFLVLDIKNSDYYKYQSERAGTSDRIYYSGANVRVYFGDIWVEEMASIQFSVQENVAPIYGFNSYMFDKVARGTRMVTGAFILNHTENGYLDVILERLQENIDTDNDNFLTEGSVGNIVSDLSYADSDRNIENLLQIDGTKSYNTYINDLKNSFWGPTSASQNTIHRSGREREFDTTYFKDPEGTGRKNPLKDHGFNILIDYSAEANERDFESTLKGLQDRGSLTQSFRSIIGVHITGENQIISPDGQVIQTQYNFIARDIDGDISQLSMKHNRLYNAYDKQTLGVDTAFSSSPESKAKNPRTNQAKERNSSSTKNSSVSGGKGARGGGGGGSR